MKPRALDLFCCAGGAAVGLHRAGFDIIGVDIERQKSYPFPMVIANALAAPFDLTAFDLIWASPPCQAYTGMQRLNTRASKRDHPKLIEPVREMLKESGVPYIIENVPGAPLINPIVLCGSMFGLNVRRHRLFECSFWALQPQCQHDFENEPMPVWGDGRPSRQEVDERDCLLSRFMVIIRNRREIRQSALTALAHCGKGKWRWELIGWIGGHSRRLFRQLIPSSLGEHS